MKTKIATVEISKNWIVKDGQQWQVASLGKGEWRREKSK